MSGLIIVVIKLKGHKPLWSTSSLQAVSAQRSFPLVTHRFSSSPYVKWHSHCYPSSESQAGVGTKTHIIGYPIVTSFKLRACTAIAIHFRSKRCRHKDSNIIVPIVYHQLWSGTSYLPSLQYPPGCRTEINIIGHPIIYIIHCEAAQPIAHPLAVHRGVGTEV